MYSREELIVKLSEIENSFDSYTDSKKGKNNYNELINIEKINFLLNELRSYDYIGVKIAMGVSTIKDYEKEIAYTEMLREFIRKLK